MKLKKRGLLVIGAMLISSMSINVGALESEVLEKTTTIESQAPETQTNTVATFTLDSGKVTMDGSTYWLPAVTKVIDKEVYIPLKFAAEKMLNLKLAESETIKEIYLQDKDHKVKLVKDSTEAITNGEKIILSKKVCVEQKVTMIPVSLLKEIFGVDVVKKDKLITLTTGGEPTYKSTIPKAGFVFSQEEYIAGQVVNTINQSTDEDGDAIVDAKWRINNDPNKTSSTLHPMFRTPWKGTYDVSLMVKDSHGMWSDWYTQKITILPNKSPVLKTLETRSETFKAGEPIGITYSYDNENWEELKQEKWTYKKVGETSLQRIFAKPDRIFEEGEYIVGLRLIDAYGNQSEEKEVTVTIRGGKTGGEFKYIAENGRQGQVLANFKKFNYRKYNEAKHDISNEEGTLLVSDSPEAVVENGIVYQDTLARNGTLLIHHINNFSKEENDTNPKKLVVMVENNTSEPGSITVKNKAIKGPNTDILHLGQDLMHDYYQGGPATTYTLQPGEKKYIYETGKGKWKKDYLVTGMLDFEIQGEVKMYVASIDEDASIDSVNTMLTPPRDGHVRGSYSVTDKYYNVELTGKEPENIIFCKEQAEWLHGYDGITHEEVDNRGNYGVMYHLKTKTVEKTTVILSPRGGHFKGAIKFNGKVFNVPEEGHLPGPERACYLGTVEAGQPIEIEYMLPNGSNAPVLLSFVPEKDWTKID